MKINPYIQDILSQPQAIRSTLQHFNAQILQEISQMVQASGFQRIILTGMGASYYGSYPAWVSLMQQGLPAFWVDTGELCNYFPELITPESLLWIVSQSGKSAEILALLEMVRQRPARAILATTNDMESELALQSDLALDLHIGEESTVSTRSYVSTLAANALAVAQMTGKDAEKVGDELQQTAQGVENYLKDWQEQVQRWEKVLGVPERLYILGRGPSLAAVKTGALILKESAKFQVEGLNSAQFRHGPLELADPRLAAIFLAGKQPTRAMNRKLAEEMRSHRAQVVWIGEQTTSNASEIPMPVTPEAGEEIAEMIPIQMLSLALAEQTGVEPGIFRYIGKITQEQ